MASPIRTPDRARAQDAAGLWPRALAWLVDAGVIGVPVLLLMAAWPGERFAMLGARWRAIGSAAGAALRDTLERGESPLALLAQGSAAQASLHAAITGFMSALHADVWPWLALFLVLAALVWPMQEAGPHRATWGKRLLGLEVRDVSELRDLRRRRAAQDRAPAWPQALARHLAGSLSWLTLNIGHLLAARAPEHRALHDRIAQAQVHWRAGAERRLPAWGYPLLAIALLLPLWLAVAAAMSLSAAMQAALVF